jgi:hypothetical protein
MFSPSRSMRLHSWYASTAGVVTLALLAWATGFSPYFILRAHADQLETLTDTLSTSQPDIGADHTIRFVTPTGIAADDSTIVVSLPAGFDVSTITEDDIDVTDDGVDLTTAPACGAVQAAVTVVGQDITIQVCNGGGGAIGATSIVTIKIGTNATTSGTGTHKIVNHASAGSYVLGITGTMADVGYTRLVIVDVVRVSGQVDTYLNFAVTGVDADQTVNADATQTFATTTATTVAFGVVQPLTAYVLAQDLAVTTNAVNGFTVTVNAAGDLQSSSGATINSFKDGADTASPTAWVGPTATVGAPDTYGHWGLTTQDITLSDNDSFGDALYVGNFISNPREVMYATTSADGSMPNVGTTRVGYKLQVSTMQEAARDYTTSLTYVVTPVF